MALTIDLTGKRALVTGASDGIGMGDAKLLAASAADPGLFAPSSALVERPLLEALLPRLRKRWEALRAGTPTDATVNLANLADAAQVERTAQQIATQFGPVAILVCSAGTNVPNRFLNKLTPADFGKVIDINLKGVAQCVMSVLPGMRAQANGVIVVVSSWAGREFLPFTGMAYNSAKAALTMLARSVNHDEGRHGIRCTLVQPGEVYTPILKSRPRPDRKSVV